MKKILVSMLCLSLLLSFAACGDPKSPSTQGGSSDSVSSAVSTDVSADTSADASTDNPEQPVTVPNLVLAIDQIKERVVVYDIDKYEEGDSLDDLEVWSVETGHAAGVKYREDTVFGDVVIVGGSKSAIYAYPSKEEIWSTTNPGNNTHSIEILPSGNIVLANSTGDSLRVFASSAILEGDTVGAQKFKDYELTGAHGVLWDPEYNVLWALGGYELTAFSVRGSGTEETLTKIGGMGVDISELGYGHDLQPDYTDSRYLYFTAGNAYRFDKEENKAGGFPQSSKMQLDEIKGFSNNPNNNYFSTGELGGAGKFFEGHWKESWLTDTIIFYTKEEVRGKIALQKLELVSETSAFYKVRAFCGQYQ